MAYAKPGKGLLKLNGEARNSKQGSEQQHNGVCSSKRACRDWVQQNSAHRVFRLLVPLTAALLKLEAQQLQNVHMITHAYFGFCSKGTACRVDVHRELCSRHIIG